MPPHGPQKVEPVGERKVHIVYLIDRSTNVTIFVVNVLQSEESSLDRAVPQQVARRRHDEVLTHRVVQFIDLVGSVGIRLEDL